MKTWQKLGTGRCVLALALGGGLFGPWARPAATQVSVKEPIGTLTTTTLTKLVLEPRVAALESRAAASDITDTFHQRDIDALKATVAAQQEAINRQQARIGVLEAAILNQQGNGGLLGQ